MEQGYFNNLIHSTSPYLLQHARNPVQWNPWSDLVIEKAISENKLILVSIGYSACHWCHVMEHESFSDTEVAKLMNEKFICVKVDREERPDIDHFYMTAVQLMGIHGGWPLNIIALPDGSPVWGGTYFTKEMWIKNLKAISNFYVENPEQTKNYALNLKKGIEQVSLFPEVEKENIIGRKEIGEAVNNWKNTFDTKYGGRVGKPKFPMPVTLDFLLYFGYIKNDRQVLNFVETTLDKMARGGINDQAGGGFSRYSVDEFWKVPHFEKMLYDNGQLIGIYSKAFRQFKKKEYKQVVFETVNFLERELTDENGAFYSSLDADSDGEEGKFYVWKTNELQKLTGQEFSLFADYFQVGKKGFWENGNNILLREISDIEFADKHSISLEELEKKVQNWKKILLKERSKRNRPGLDNKILTSWNAIVIQGLTEAFKAFHNNRFLDMAIKNANYLKTNCFAENGKVFHSGIREKTTIDGFLEDYAFSIQAFISLFEITGDENYLHTANRLMEYTFEHFYDPKSGLFYFSEKSENKTLTNHFQIEDNVIPAVNSVMANNLHRMFLLFGNHEFQQIAKKMLLHAENFSKYPMAYSNWGNTLLQLLEPSFEVVICGADAATFAHEIQSSYFPNVFCVFTSKPVKIPVFNNRIVTGKTLIYVCREQTCNLPVETVNEAKKLLEHEFGVAEFNK